MSLRRIASTGRITTLALLATASHAPPAAAQTSGPTTSLDPTTGPQSHSEHSTGGAASEAGRHFRRGVELYGAREYAGALVEFKLAFDVAPSTATLYNVGETQYQLQDYPAALRTFLRFLSESGPQDGHRADVERDVGTLRARVGRVNVTTVPEGADISVDGQAVGKTPLGEPLHVSTGRRKVVASMAGRTAVTEYVDVAADGDVWVTLEMHAADITPTQATSGIAGGSRALQTTGLVLTCSLAAGAVIFGVRAVAESSSLKDQRDAFPASSAIINHDASLTRTYSLLADAMTAATIIVGGATLYWTLQLARAKSDHVGSLRPPRVTLGPTAARFDMSF
ncbi:MAG: PEGA domain-containing protein [Myxococcota bacterium]|nr:PEGA domain-containing protein [Myxococcota bacterium]